MLPIVFTTRKKIFKHYTGFSFFVFVWVSTLEKDQERLLRHERIHFRQQVELLFIFHWLLYGLFYIILRINGHKHYISYRSNPFEIEAYENECQVDYLRQRRLFSWGKYLRPFRDSLKKKSTFSSPTDKPIH